MTITGRTLTTDVIAALTYWPQVLHGGGKYPPDPVDLTVLPPFLNGLLADLPWWNRDWKVSRVEPGLPLEIGSDHRGHPARFTEVYVPGTVGPGDGDGDGESLPFVATIGFAGDRLIRFQAKIDDMVVGPAVAPAGQPEPHPFARVLTGLLDLRGIPVRNLARETGRSRSTIQMLRSGRHNPEPLLVQEIAGALGMSEADV
nr:helix-turn-helix transcriptional regulator [Streptomyces sp. DSM 41633]